MVLLYRYLDQFIFSSSTNLTSLPKPKSIHESPTEPITGLGFREPSPSNKEKDHHHLFIVTTSRILSYQVSGKGSGSAPSVVDELGAGLGCAVMDWYKKDIVVARDEAIYLCGVEGRGTAFAFEGLVRFLLRDFILDFTNAGSRRPKIVRPDPPELPRHRHTALHSNGLLRFRYRPEPGSCKPGKP